MSTAILVGVLLLALGVGWWLAWYAGGSDERSRTAEDTRDEALKQSERMAGPLPSSETRTRAALRELARRGVRLPQKVVDAALRRAKSRGPDRDRDRSA